jgi:hypothetical protein
VDKKGNVVRELKIHPRLKPALEDALQEFKEMFGRKPGHGDPILFNHHLTGEDDFGSKLKLWVRLRILLNSLFLLGGAAASS